MGTLRVAFLSGAVLELAATLGRRARRRHGRRAARRRRPRPPACADGARARAGALPPAAQARGAVPRERRRDRGRRADARSLERAGRRAQRKAAWRRARATRRSGSRRSRSPTRRAPGLVLDGVDLELHPGETVALVGPSGAGKTTVASLLLRFADPTRGPDLRRRARPRALPTRTRWREQLAWVPQRPTLFRGTVADNIRLGDPGATERARSRRGRARGRRRASSRRFRRLRDASSATADARSPPESADGSRSRGRSCATRRS